MDLGIGHRLERREPLWEEIQCQSVRHEDLHDRGGRTSNLLYIAAPMLDIAQHGFGNAGEPLAGAGQHHLVGAAIDEFHAKPFFERANAAANGRLRNAAGRRRAREVPGEY